MIKVDWLKLFESNYVNLHLIWLSFVKTYGIYRWWLLWMRESKYHDIHTFFIYSNIFTYSNADFCINMKEFSKNFHVLYTYTVLHV